MLPPCLCDWLYECLRVYMYLQLHIWLVWYCTSNKLRPKICFGCEYISLCECYKVINAWIGPSASNREWICCEPGFCVCVCVCYTDRFHFDSVYGISRMPRWINTFKRLTFCWRNGNILRIKNEEFNSIKVDRAVDSRACVSVLQFKSDHTYGYWILKRFDHH